MLACLHVILYGSLVSFAPGLRKRVVDLSDLMPEVQVQNLGVLHGTADGQNVAYFKGVPYAKPPIGPRRWQPPEAHGPWQSPRDATKFGAGCPQEREATTEDCLFLNVATPVDALQGGRSLPVMIWIHGGAYQSGKSNHFSPEALVAASNNQVVVVTVNYRLNIFGFLASAEVQASTSDGSKGNFGIQDQRMAMAWVKDHISAFGGDSASVTIFGESAGGNSVMNHVVRPASFPYFTRAIIQSGTYDEGVISAGAEELRYQQLLNKAGCGDLACLRGKDTETILGIQGAGLSGPVVDDVELTATPAQLIAQGKHSKVPILIGATRDEYLSSFWGFDFNVSSEAEFDAKLAAQPWLAPHVNSNNRQEVKDLYHPSVYSYPEDLGGYSHWTWALGRVATDQVPGLGACGVRWIARSLLAGGSPSVHVYSFDYPPQRRGPGSTFAGHTVEIPFVFGKPMGSREASNLAATVSRHWVAFSTTGNPNVLWPTYTAEGDTVLRFNVASKGGIRTEQNMRKDACDYFQALAGYS